MTRALRVYVVLLVAFGIFAGIGIDRVWFAHGVAKTVSAQERAGGAGRNPLPSMESLPAEVAQLKLLVPSNSHIMMDVQFHWTAMYFAAQKKNWPLAQYWFNETRGHIQQLVRKNPTIRNQVDGTDVELQGIFDGIDTSSLAMVKDAIAKKDSVEFEKDYRIMLESCYACHKSVGRPYIRPQIPTGQVMSIANLDPAATWPQ